MDRAVLYMKLYTFGMPFMNCTIAEIIYFKFYIRFLIIRMNTILSNILKYRKTLILPRIYHD